MVGLDGKQMNSVKESYINVSEDSKTILYKNQVVPYGGTLYLTPEDKTNDAVKSFFAHQRLSKSETEKAQKVRGSVGYGKAKIDEGVYTIRNLDGSFPDGTGKRVAFFFENINTHYSGGRYYAWLMIYALANLGYRVDVYTNLLPSFYGDFSKIQTNGGIKVYLNEKFSEYRFLKEDKYDLYFGVPRRGWESMIMNSEGFDKPKIFLIFESPNYTRLFRGGRDSTEEYWAKYKPLIMKSDYIYSLNILCRDYTRKWLPDYKGKIYSLYPCFNNTLADTVQPQNTLNEVAFISRIVSHKNTTQAIKCLEGIDPPPLLNILCNPLAQQQIDSLNNSARNSGVRIRIHQKVSDLQKFAILRKCKAMVFPTTMEGFGIPPAEALYYDIPVIVYDLPFFKEEYGNTLEYSPLAEGVDGLRKNLIKVLKDDTYRKMRGFNGNKFVKEAYTFEVYCKRLKRLIERSM